MSPKYANAVVVIGTGVAVLVFAIGVILGWLP